MERLRFPGVPNLELSDSVWKSDQFYVSSNPPRLLSSMKTTASLVQKVNFITTPKSILIA